MPIVCVEDKSLCPTHSSVMGWVKTPSCLVLIPRTDNLRTSDRGMPLLFQPQELLFELHFNDVLLIS